MPVLMWCKQTHDLRRWMNMLHPVSAWCTTPRLNPAEDLFLLWTCLSEGSLAALFMCENKPLDKIRTQFSRDSESSCLKRLMWEVIYNPDAKAYDVQLRQHLLQWHELHVGGEAFVEPQVVPPAHSHQVSKPLQHNIRDRSRPASSSPSLLLSKPQRQTKLPDERAHAQWRKQPLVSPEGTTVCPQAGWSHGKWWVPSSPWLLPGSLGWLPSLAKRKNEHIGCVNSEEKK